MSCWISLERDPEDTDLSASPLLGRESQELPAGEWGNEAEKGRKSIKGTLLNTLLLWTCEPEPHRTLGDYVKPASELVSTERQETCGNYAPNSMCCLLRPNTYDLPCGRAKRKPLCEVAGVYRRHHHVWG